LADRFTYIPYLGLFFLFAAVYDRVVALRPASRPLLLAGVGAYALLMALATVRQVPVWKNGDTLWTHVLKHYDNTPLPFAQRAYYYRTFAKQYQKALADYNQAAKLDPRRKQTFNSRGKLYFDLRKYDEAIADYNKAIELDASNAEYFANRGAAYALKGQKDLAVQDLNKCLALDPNHINGLLNRSLILRDLGQLEPALKDYDTYLKLRPAEGNMWYERGLCYRALNRQREAISDFTQALRLDPAGKFTQLYYLERAKAHLALDNQDQARADAQQAKLRGAALPLDLAKLMP
jgi:tetratricopeptide (TPR) repeat protein